MTSGIKTSGPITVSRAEQTGLTDPGKIKAATADASVTIVAEADVSMENRYAFALSSGWALPLPDAIPNETPPYAQMQIDLRNLSGLAGSTSTYSRQGDDVDVSALVALAQSAFMKSARLMRQMAKEQMWHAQDRAMASAKKGSEGALKEAAANQLHEQTAGIQAMAGGALQVAGGVAATHQVVQSARLGKSAGKAGDEATSLRNQHADAADEFSAQHDRLTSGNLNKAEQTALNQHIDQHAGVKRAREERDDAASSVQKHDAQVKRLQKEHNETWDSYRKDAEEFGPGQAHSNHEVKLKTQAKALEGAQKDLANAQKSVVQRTEWHDELEASLGPKHIEDKLAQGKANVRSLRDRHEASAKEAGDLHAAAESKLRISQAISQLSQGVSGVASGAIQTTGSSYVLEAGEHAANVKLEQGKQDVANMDANVAKEAADAALQLFDSALQTQGTVEQDKQRLMGNIAGRV